MVASTDQYFGLKINSNVVINCWGPPNLMTCKHVTLSRGFFEGANRVASIGLGCGYGGSLLLPTPFLHLFTFPHSRGN